MPLLSFQQLILFNVVLGIGTFIIVTTFVALTILQWKQNETELSAASSLDPTTGRIIDVNSPARTTAELHEQIRYLGRHGRYNETHYLDISHVTDFTRLFYGLGHFQDASLSSWDVSHVTKMQGCFEYSRFRNGESIARWNVSRVQDMNAMFRYNPLFQGSSEMSLWDVSRVTDMSGMFERAKRFDTSILDSWNIESVQDMGYMLAATTIGKVPAGWSTSHVTNMRGLFQGALNIADGSALQHWDVSYVTDLSYMFAGVSITPSVSSSLHNWDTRRVTRLKGLFQGASLLASSLGIESWDVSQVTDISSLWRDCSSRNGTPITLSHWNTRGVRDMSHLWQGSTNLTISGLANWDTSAVTDLSYLMADCDSGIQLQVDYWNVSRVTNLSHAFDGLHGWPFPNVSQWDVSGMKKSNSSSWASAFGGGDRVMTFPYDLSQWDIDERSLPCSYFQVFPKVRMVDWSWVAKWFQNCTLSARGGHCEC